MGRVAANCGRFPEKPERMTVLRTAEFENRAGGGRSGEPLHWSAAAGPQQQGRSNGAEAAAASRMLTITAFLVARRNSRETTTNAPDGRTGSAAGAAAAARHSDDPGAPRANDTRRSTGRRRARGIGIHRGFRDCTGDFASPVGTVARRRTAPSRRHREANALQWRKSRHRFAPAVQLAGDGPARVSTSVRTGRPGPEQRHQPNEPHEPNEPGASRSPASRPRPTGAKDRSPAGKS